VYKIQCVYTSGTTRLSADCCFSELALKNKNSTKRVGLLKIAATFQNTSWVLAAISNMHKNVLIVHPVKIPVKFGFIQQSGFREED
jgi:hypothetical protein